MPGGGGRNPRCRRGDWGGGGHSGRKVELIVGKPSPITVEVALGVLNLPAARCLMVGDCIETDILMGNNFGLDTALVMTGVTGRGTLEASDIVPTYVLDSVGDIRVR